MARHNDVLETEMFKEFGCVIIMQVLTIVISIAIVLILAIIYDAAGRSLSWLASTWILSGLYFCPLYFALSALPILYFRYLRSIFKLTKSISLMNIAKLFIHSQLIFLTIVTILLTILSVRSAYIPMLSIFFYIITNVIIMALDKFTNMNNKNEYIWIFIHFIGVLFSYIYYCSLALTAFGTFIPIQARSGPASNPEFMICMLCILMGILLAGQILPLIILCRWRIYLSISFLIFWLVCFILMFTSVGYPYREKSAPQRYWVHHIEQKFHDAPDQIQTGFYFHPMDRHAFDYTNEFLNESYFIPHNCSGKIYCGYPHYHNSEYNRINSSRFYVIPDSEKPKYEIPTNFNLISKTNLNQTVERFRFSLNGPDHMALYVVPVIGVKIISWSFNTPIPKPNKEPQSNRDAYYIAFLYGNMDNNPFEFTLTLQYDSNINENDNKIEFGVVGQYMHQENDRTIFFIDFLSKFPETSVQYNWVSTYQSMVFQ